MENDPLGNANRRFICKTSLDELPQFYNVLIKIRSLVGTRPQRLTNTKNIRQPKNADLSFKPGITGLGKERTQEIKDFDEAVKLDVAYMDD